MSSIKKRGKRWRGRAYILDPASGKRRVLSVSGRTKDEVDKELTRQLGDIERGEYVDPQKTTFGEWLDQWFETAIEGTARPRTEERYKGIIRDHLKPNLGGMPLQRLQATHIEKYYKDAKSKDGKKKLMRPTLALHHVVIHSALEAAVRKRILNRNEASLVDGKPRRREKTDTTEIRENVWGAEEAKQFLAVCRETGPQQFAFYSVALELGSRKNELAAFRWDDVDLDAGTVRLVRQLTARGTEPKFGSLKSGYPRTLDISPGLVEALRRHKAHQAELKLRNRGAYHDHGLLFAKEWRDLSRGRAKLGDPIQTNNIGQREFASLLKKAGVKKITIHGLRHTSATLALAAGVDVKTVAHRLGHSKTSITLDLYSHVVPSMSKDAAQRIGSLLHG